jgi:hypothetical protein
VVEWINPKYAYVMAALRKAQAAQGGADQRPVRGFLVPSK